MPSDPCLSFKSLSCSQNHSPLSSAAALQQTERDAARAQEPLERKNQQIYVWNYIAPVIWNFQRIWDEVESKQMENNLFSCPFKAEQYIGADFYLQTFYRRGNMILETSHK